MNCGPHLIKLAFEEMAGRLDEDQLLGFSGARNDASEQAPMIAVSGNGNSTNATETGS